MSSLITVRSTLYGFTCNIIYMPKGVKNFGHKSVVIPLYEIEYMVSFVHGLFECRRVWREADIRFSASHFFKPWD
jgi:hypothetical protein